MKYNLATPNTNYLNALHSVGCNAFIDKPTRIKSGAATCLDHVYSNLDTGSIENHVILAEVSDHFGTLSKIEGITCESNKRNVYYRKTNLSDKKWKELDLFWKNTSIRKIPFPHALKANELANAIKDTYDVTNDRFMPEKKRAINPNQKPDRPWITSGLKASIAKMYELLRISKQSGLFEDNKKYKAHLNMLTTLKRKCKNDYFKELMKSYGQDRSKTWQLVNKITNFRRKSTTTIKCLVDKDGNKLTNPLDIANTLNNHFGSIGKIMAQEFDNLDNCQVKDPLSYISKDVRNSIFLSMPKAEEISKNITRLLDKNSCGYDLVSNRTLKATNHSVSPLLEILFQKCISEGVFPDCFKIAQVIPLFKGGDNKDPHCYRPISLLPTISKIFEKLLATRLIKFLTKHKVLSPDQFGFRAKFSTEYAIVDIYDKLIKNLDEGLSSCAIFLDLAKAFDSVSHAILLRKMHCYGIRGIALQLFKSYLSSRSQFVKLPCGTKSSLTSVEYGVPQGSILGPLLFLLFINDLPGATNLYIKLFADDTFLCAQNKDFSLLQNEVNVELEKVFIWLASNKLTLNIKKSKFMLITRKQTIPKFCVKINNSPLESCDSYKYLGVIIDKKLNWELHVKHITPKIAKACGALARLRNFVSIDILKEVYYALIHSYLRYGILIWGNASNSVLQPLQTLLNKAVRIMVSAPFGNIDLNPAYEYLKLLDIPQIFFLETGKHHFKFVKGLLPTQIGNYFSTSIDNPIQHTYGLRSQSRNDPPRIFSQSKTGEKAIQFKGSQIWNILPPDIKSCESFSKFKTAYKKFLLEFGIDSTVFLNQTNLLLLS